MTHVNLKINGTETTVEVEDRTLLVQLLREKLGMTGTHVGCDTTISMAARMRGPNME